MTLGSSIPPSSPEALPILQSTTAKASGCLLHLTTRSEAPLPRPPSPVLLILVLLCCSFQTLSLRHTTARFPDPSMTTLKVDIPSHALLLFPASPSLLVELFALVSLFHSWHNFV